MPDISMCCGEGCEASADCYRHTAKPNVHFQSYFNPKRTEPDGSCREFWGNAGCASEFAGTTINRETS